MSESTISERVRELRRRHGLTQEELAEAAELSLAVVKKVEQGGSVRMETLHRIARVFGVVTVAFVAPGSPEPAEVDLDEMVLAELRSAVHPPVGMTGEPIYGLTESGEPDLGRLSHAVRKAAVAYDTGRFDDLAVTMPALVRSAHHHVQAFDRGDDRREALRLRASVTGLAGWYLIQLRAHDLALAVLRASAMDAAQVDDILLAASAVSAQGWAMLRQGRLAEVERLCVEAADAVEPRMSKATPDRLSGWGWLLAQAAVAASRNNRPQEAREYATLVQAAGARLGREHNRPGYGSFGPVSAAVIAAEVEVIVGRPDAALLVAGQIPPDAAWPNALKWNRHRLSVANAYLALNKIDEATDTLAALRRTHPEWLRYQQYGRDVVRKLLAKRPRMPNQEQRRLADFMKVEG